MTTAGSEAEGQTRPTRLHLCARNTRIVVESRTPRVLEAVASMFPEFVSHDPSRASADGGHQLAATEGRDASFSVAVDGHPRARDLDWGDLLAQLEHTIAEILLGAFPSLLPLHAGAASVGGGGLVLLGPSGSGKSSLTTALLLRGCRIFGDDVVLLDAAGRVAAFPRRPKVDVAQAVRLGLEPSGTVLWHEGADECWIDASQFGGWSDPQPVRALLRVKFVARHETTTITVSPAVMLTTLIASVVPREGLAPGEELTGSLAGLASRVPAFDLRYGDADNAASALLETFSARSADP